MMYLANKTFQLSDIATATWSQCSSPVNTLMDKLLQLDNVLHKLAIPFNLSLNCIHVASIQ